SPTRLPAGRSCGDRPAGRRPLPWRRGPGHPVRGLSLLPDRTSRADDGPPIQAFLRPPRRTFRAASGAGARSEPDDRARDGRGRGGNLVGPITAALLESVRESEEHANLLSQEATGVCIRALALRTEAARLCRHAEEVRAARASRPGTTSYSRAP